VPVTEGASYPVAPSTRSEEFEQKRTISIMSDVQRQVKDYVATFGTQPSAEERRKMRDQAIEDFDSIHRMVPTPQQGGQPPTPPAQQSNVVKVGDTFTGTDGNQYRYLGGGKYEPVR
jgi:hypothetical protein